MMPRPMTSVKDFTEHLLDCATTSRLCRRIQIPRRHAQRTCTETFAAHGRLVAASRWKETAGGAEEKFELWLLDRGRLGLVTRSGRSALQSEWDLGEDGAAELTLLSLEEAARMFAAGDMLTVD